MVSLGGGKLSGEVDKIGLVCLIAKQPSSAGFDIRP